MNPSKIRPFPEPGCSAYEWRPWFRNRRICFIIEDWQRIGEALHMAFPEVRYKREARPLELMGAAVPPISVRADLGGAILDAAQHDVGLWIVFDRDWQLEFVPPQRPGEWWKQSSVTRLPRTLIRSTSCVYPAGPRAPEHVYSGDISFSVEPKNQQQGAFMRAFWSLLGKFSSNRHQVEVTYPGYEYFNPKTVTNLWIGNEAARWTRENPARLLDYKQIATSGPVLGAGLRPIEEDWPERRKRALETIDPILLAQPTAHAVEEYSGPSSARQAVLRRAMRAKELKAEES